MLDPRHSLADQIYRLNFGPQAPLWTMQLFDLKAVGFTRLRGGYEREGVRTQNTMLSMDNYLYKILKIKHNFSSNLQFPLHFVGPKIPLK